MIEHERQGGEDEPAGVDPKTEGAPRPAEPSRDRLILRGQTKSPGEETDDTTGGPSAGPAF